MKLRTTLALAVASLTIGVPAAAADSRRLPAPAQVRAQPDAIDRYLRNNAPVRSRTRSTATCSNNAPSAQPDALDRYLRNNAPQQSETTGAATHPDSRAVGRAWPATSSRSAATAATGRPVPSARLGGALLAILAIVGASAIRERRRLALR